jgi:predicted alpha/beta superfamily hydrolase
MHRATICTPLQRAMALLALSFACQPTAPPAAPCPPPPPQSPEALSAPAEPPAAASAPKKLVIKNSELVELHSEQTGRDYEIIVGLPPSYAKEPDRHYPVLYVLDGQWDFTLVNMLTGGLRYDKVSPEVLIVGISYAGEDPNYDKLRAEDYTPTRSHPTYAKEAYGGDGPKFLQFLEQNVLPTVEQRYRVDASQRVLSGSSLGGLFTLYALIERPDLFQSYLALSPAVGWDDRYIFRREREFHAQRPRLEKHVWLSVGEMEWPDYVKDDKAFFAQFEKSHYEGLALRVQVVAGEHHSGVKPEAYNRAVRFVFEPWAAAQKPE